MRRTLVTIFAASIAAAVVAALAGARSIGTILAAPALAISAWLFLGHLVTLDDDAAGGWSNPFESRQVWRSSLRELLVKFAVFVAVLILVLWLWLRQQ